MDAHNDVGAGAGGGGKGAGGALSAAHLEGSTQDPAAARESVMVPTTVAGAGDQGAAGGDGTRPPFSAQQPSDLQGTPHQGPLAGAEDVEEGTNGRDGGAGSNGGEGKDKQRNGGAGKDGHSNGGEGKGEQRNGGGGKDEQRNGGGGKDEQRNGGAGKGEQDGGDASYHTALEDEQQRQPDEGEARSTTSSRGGGRGLWGMLGYAAQLAMQWGGQWLHKVEDEELRTAMGSNTLFMETVQQQTFVQSQYASMAMKTADMEKQMLQQKLEAVQQQLALQQQTMALQLAMQQQTIELMTGRSRPSWRCRSCSLCGARCWLARRTTTGRAS